MTFNYKRNQYKNLNPDMKDYFDDKNSKNP